LTSAAAVAAAGGISTAAEAAVEGPKPAQIDELKSDNPHGGQLVAHALKREGVSRLFTLCGGHILPILDGCLDEDIQVLDGRHEEAVAHMAEAWSRITGEVGVISVTAGPGMTNAVTGVANAYENGVPMLILGGRSSVEDNEIGSLQDIDQMDLYESITKWSRVCYETERIPEYVALAFRYALSGRPAPVYLELPQDILMGRVEKSQARFPDNYRAIDRPRGSKECIADAAKILSEAKRPIIMVGAGCRWCESEVALKEFADHTGIPVLTHTGGRGAFPDSHPLSLFPARANQLRADAVLLLGVRVDFMLGYGQMFPKPMKVIQVDIEPTNLGFNRGPDCAVAGDIAHVLEDLKDALPANGHPGWADEAKGMVEMGMRMATSQVNFDAVPIHPLRVATELRDFGGTDACYVVDGGFTCIWGVMTLPAERPGDVMGVTSGPMGCLGVGLPFALAAKSAAPDRNVFLMVGDGAFGLNAVEMDTAVRHNLPVVAVVVNDGAWGMIKAAQIGMYGRDRLVASELKNVRYDKWVEGFGGHGEFVEKPGDIRPALERALASGKPACVNVACQTIPIG
jgi:acetolactate synthase-1/2/3 large subunit